MLGTLVQSAVATGHDMCWVHWYSQQLQQDMICAEYIGTVGSSNRTWYVLDTLVQSAVATGHDMCWVHWYSRQ